MRYRRYDEFFRGSMIAAVATAAATLLVSGAASAQTPHITTDGTMGDAVSFTDQHVDIPSTLGTLKGGNLFHSFGTFDIPAAHGATFTDSTASSIDNVISRVTGGSTSMIDGTLASTIPNSDFFFINPAGVVFGPDAQIDVPGSFHVGTAEAIVFPDGEFNATNPDDTVLSSAPPEAFGFLNDNPASIEILRSSLEIAAGETFSIVGGDILFEGTDAPSITAEGGSVIIVSVAGAGNVAIGTDPATGTFTQLGDITFVTALEEAEEPGDDEPGDEDDAPDPNIDVSGDGGGRVIIRGGKLLADSYSIAANTEGDEDGATVGIDIDLSGTLTLTGESQFASITEGSGRGGDVVVSAAELIMREEAEILSDTDRGGQGGRVAITADLVSLSGDAEIASDVDERASGAGGSVTITAKRIVLSGDSEISSDTGGAGAGGTVALIARSSIRLLDEAGIFTDSEGKGDAGDIVIDSGEQFVSRGGVIATSAATAAGGNVTLNADFLIHLVDSAITTSVGSGQGDGGNIAIDPDFLVLDSSVIQANAFGGNGGNITIVAGQLVATPDSRIEASSALGVDGTVNISSPDTQIAGDLTVLPSSLVDVANLLAEHCAAQGSSLAGAGRGGLPASPDQPLSDSYSIVMAPGQQTGSGARSGTQTARLNLRLDCGS